MEGGAINYAQTNSSKKKIITMSQLIADYSCTHALLAVTLFEPVVVPIAM